MTFRNILNFLESLSRLPAESWIIPPVLIVGALAFSVWRRHRALLSALREIAAHTGLDVHDRWMTPSDVAGSYRGRSLVMTTTSPRRYSFNRWWTLVIVDLKIPVCVQFRIRRKDALDRVLRNLVSNAIKYSPPGSRVRVRIRPAAGGTAVQMEVEDEGDGIAVDDLARVFEPYYRAPDAMRAARGAGLGLAVVKSLVEAHGGSIRAERRDARGTRMTLLLPSVS